MFCFTVRGEYEEKEVEEEESSKGEQEGGPISEEPDMSAQVPNEKDKKREYLFHAITATALRAANTTVLVLGLSLLLSRYFSRRLSMQSC